MGEGGMMGLWGRDGLHWFEYWGGDVLANDQVET